ncbi:MAG: hypothetical protein NC299_15645 [Lachnospiraceae bacterium]|nr:hypothetical protein [Ruminococcus sp.]MCM1276767.1 hypothetical protein [Lachnospiraceae bacterium]
MNKNVNQTNAGVVAGKVTNFVIVLTQIVFLILKFCGAIDWDWVWVMSPGWMTFCISNGLLFLGNIIKGLVVSSIFDDMNG